MQFYENVFVIYIMINKITTDINSLLHTILLDIQATSNKEAPSASSSVISS
jgi:hypothetical protein